MQRIGEGYRVSVSYHNDLHGCDVAQQMYSFLTKGDLAKIAKLNYLDQLSALVAAACHDYDHDGFNNAYHVKFMTDRAIRANDKAVQENWHAAKSMKILLSPECKFLEDILPGQLKVIKMRITGMILATDMASHQGPLEALQKKIESKHVTKEKQNSSALIESVSEIDLFKNQ